VTSASVWMCVCASHALAKEEWNTLLCSNKITRSSRTPSAKDIKIDIIQTLLLLVYGKILYNLKMISYEISVTWTASVFQAPFQTGLCSCSAEGEPFCSCKPGIMFSSLSSRPHLLYFTLNFKPQKQFSLIPFNIACIV
jgi:hypothetical protein